MSRKAVLAIFISITVLFATLGIAFGETNVLLPDFETELFAGSDLCVACHGDLEESSLNIDDLWGSTLLANAGKDPFMAAKLESEILRTPSREADLEATCPICHQPMARTQAVADGSTVALLGDGFLDPGHALHEPAMDGISCTLCHQIKEDGLGEPASFSGNYVIDTAVAKPNRLAYGKYPDPEFEYLPDDGMAGYQQQGSTHVEHSGMCAVCHEQYVTPTDEEGNDLPVPVGGHPEQTPYQEWENSIYGDGEGDDDETCQDCHMPEVPGEVNISNDADHPRANFNEHTFEGSNTLMLAIMRDHWSDLEVTSSEAEMNEVIARNQTFLQTETAELTIPRAEISADTAYVDVAINSLVGHKFPTSVPFRRTWVHLTLIDSSDATVFESGAPLSSGQITGNDADFDFSTYEPHYDVITSSDQVQIYEAITKDSADAVTYTILRVVGYTKDNRLLPTGYDKTTAPADVQVFGNAVSDVDFVGGGDVVHYEIPLSEGATEITATVNLLYQPITYTSVQDLLVDAPTPSVLHALQKTDVDGFYIQRFAEYYAAADKTPETITSITKDLSEPSAVSLQQLDVQETPSGHPWVIIILLMGVITAAALIIQGKYRRTVK